MNPLAPPPSPRPLRAYLGIGLGVPRARVFTKMHNGRITSKLYASQKGSQPRLGPHLGFT